MFTSTQVPKWMVLSITPTTKLEAFLLKFKKKHYKHETLEVTKKKSGKNSYMITELRRISTYKILKGKEFILSSNLVLNVSYKEKEK